MSNYVMYLFINKGLGMSSGKIAAQSVQSSIGAYKLSDGELVHDWWHKGGHHTTLVMEAIDENNLQNIQNYLLDRGFNSFMMIDEGMTEVDAHVCTALAVEIVDKEDPHTEATFSSFKLYRDKVRVVLEIDK